MKQSSNVIVNEKPKYTISLKKGYKIFHIVMSIVFLSVSLGFGIRSLFADTETITSGMLFAVIFLLFLISSLYELTKKCERYKGKIVYSSFFKKREFRLSEIAFSNEKTEAFSVDHGDGNVSSSWDRVTTFYNRQGKKLFKFGLAYDNVPLLVRDVVNTQKSISNQKKR